MEEVRLIDARAVSEAADEGVPRMRPNLIVALTVTVVVKVTPDEDGVADNDAILVVDIVAVVDAVVEGDIDIKEVED